MKTVARIILVGLTWTVCSMALAEEVVLHQDFNAVAKAACPAGWVVEGGQWSVQDGRLRGAALEGEGTIWFGPPDGRDLGLSAKVRFVDARNEERWVALVLRDAGPEAPGVQLVARKNTKRHNGLELVTRRPAGSPGGVLMLQTAAATQGFSPEKWRDLQIEARGEWIRAFIDGDQVFECPRGGDASSAGRTGLRVNGAVVEFDDVKITQLDPISRDELRRLRTHPLVIAHRGFSARAPENTLVSYRMAIEAGADMAECDVYVTADDVVVLLHDKNLKRTTGRDATVNSLPLSAIQELDAGSWKSPEFAGERIPTLVEALELVHRKLRLVIEIKQEDIEAEVIAAIRKAGVGPEEVMIFSFHREVVEKIAVAEPRLPTTWLIGDLPHERAVRREIISAALQARCTAIGLPAVRVDPAIVRVAHESGLPVFVWTANTPADIRYLIRIGVDGIITDHPDVALKMLEE